MMFIKKKKKKKKKKIRFKMIYASYFVELHMLDVSIIVQNSVTQENPKKWDTISVL